jgi:hypothetical protein
MPRTNAIPPLYLKFVERLQPWDRVLTFNYDILLERACDVVGKPYRLAPMRYTEVKEYTAAVDDSCLDEISILKLHGSVDWFDRKHYRRRQEDAQKWGHKNYVPDDPIFNPYIRTVPMVAGASGTSRTDDSHLFFVVGPAEAALDARFRWHDGKEWVPNVKIVPLGITTIR